MLSWDADPCWLFFPSLKHITDMPSSLPRKGNEFCLQMCLKWGSMKEQLLDLLLLELLFSLDKKSKNSILKGINRWQPLSALYSLGFDSRRPLFLQAGSTVALLSIQSCYSHWIDVSALVPQLPHFWWSGSAGLLLGLVSVFTGLVFLDVTFESNRINTVELWSSGVQGDGKMCALVMAPLCLFPMTNHLLGLVSFPQYFSISSFLSFLFLGLRQCSLGFSSVYIWTWADKNQTLNFWALE